MEICGLYFCGPRTIVERDDYFRSNEIEFRLFGDLSLIEVLETNVLLIDSHGIVGYNYITRSLNMPKDSDEFWNFDCDSIVPLFRHYRAARPMFKKIKRPSLTKRLATPVVRHT